MNCTVFGLPPLDLSTLRWNIEMLLKFYTVKLNTYFKFDSIYSLVEAFEIFLHFDVATHHRL